VWGHHRCDVEQAQPVNARRRPFDTVRIMDLIAKHLISAANPQYMPVASHVRLQVNIPALRPEMGKVRNGGF